MKNLILLTLSIALVIFGCSSNSNKASEETTEQLKTMEGESPSHHHKDSNHEETGVTTVDSSKIAIKSNFSIDEIVSDYLKMKNALTKDDSKAVANAGKSLEATFAKLDASGLTSEQKKSYNAVADDAKEHAEHIAANAGKINHQREHFAMLSKDIADLLKTFGTKQKLYQDHCPMYNDGKGAIWFSEIKEIKNPYYGSKMLSCGKMNKEL